MEHTALTVGLPATMLASKVRTPAGRMAIANVCQTCGRVQGSRGRWRCNQTPPARPAPGCGTAPAPGTDAAGHPLVTVRTSNPAAGAATGPAPVLAGAAVLAPGDRSRAPTTAAAPTSRTMPAAAATSSMTGRRRCAGAEGLVPTRPGSDGMPNEAGPTACPARSEEWPGMCGGPGDLGA